MGCVESREELTLPENIFKITSPVCKQDAYGNIDMTIDNNHRVSGDRFVEITDNEMVIHQGGQITQTYPLRFLRRYGFEETAVFRFEAGRKCPTGPGLYTFKCPEAQRLFTFLQNHIQTRSSVTDDNLSHRSHDGSSILPSSNMHTLRSARTSRLNSNVSNGPLSPTQPISPPPNGFVNDSIQLELENRREQDQAANTYVNVDLQAQSPLSATFSASDMEIFSTSATNNNNTTTLNNNIEEEEPHHNYANINPDEETPLDISPPQTIVTTKSPVLPPPLNLKSKPMTYLILDLDNPSPTQTSPVIPPESPSKPAGGYATIDFNKTSALSQAVSRCNSDDVNECSRKTRHNSSISDSFTFVVNKYAES